jgi:hypothetical protein
MTDIAAVIARLAEQQCQQAQIIADHTDTANEEV